MFPLPDHIFFEIGALLTSILFWYKIKNTKLCWLIYFMIFIVGVELYGRYLRKELHEPNLWLYNISIPIEYLFYGLLFYLHYTRKLFLQIAIFFLIFFSIFAISNILFIQGFEKFNTNILK